MASATTLRRLVGISLLLLGCRTTPAQPDPPASAPHPPAPVAAPLVAASADLLGAGLPERAGLFTGGPLTRAEGFVRRTYAKGDRRVEVTLASYAGTRDGYAAWVEQSRAYPAAALSIPEGSGSGFYTCSGPPARERCDLHIQLRAGYHIEVMGNGTAARGDLEELVHAIPLATLASSGGD